MPSRVIRDASTNIRAGQTDHIGRDDLCLGRAQIALTCHDGDGLTGQGRFTLGIDRFELLAEGLGFARVAFDALEEIGLCVALWARSQQGEDSSGRCDGEGVEGAHRILRPNLSSFETGETACAGWNGQFVFCLSRARRIQRRATARSTTGGRPLRN